MARHPSQDADFAVVLVPYSGLPDVLPSVIHVSTRSCVGPRDRCVETENVVDYVQLDHQGQVLRSMAAQVCDDLRRNEENAALQSIARLVEVLNARNGNRVMVQRNWNQRRSRASRMLRTWISTGHRCERCGVAVDYAAYEEEGDFLTAFAMVCGSGCPCQDLEPVRRFGWPKPRE